MTAFPVILPFSLEETASPTVPVTCVYGVCWANVLNVRSRPSTSAAIVGKVRYGQIVPVYRVHQGWVRIDPVKSMWVYAQYLNEVDPTGLMRDPLPNERLIDKVIKSIVA